MSRLRKSGRKIKGYSQPGYANKFNDGFAINIAGMVKEMQAKVKAKIEENKSSAAAATKAAKDKATASPSDRPVDEIDDKKMNYGREEIDSFFQRKKLAEEQAAFDAKKKEEEDTETAAAEEAETARENKSQGKDITFSDDYGDDMSGKERRGEKRDNRREIRAGKKEAKGVAKDEKKAKIAAAKQLKGKDKRQAKRAARKDYRKDKKAIRKAKRKNKKANRKANRKARRKKRGWSDIRVKENIIFVGYSNEGFKMYDFDYINKNHGEHRYRGLMAQDLIGLSLTDNYYSDLVTKENGCYMVDYSLTDVEMEIVKINEKAKV